MRSNSKAVRELVKAHILEQIEDGDIELLKGNLKAVSGMRDTQTVYQQAKYLVDGGSFLCYHWDVNEFLNGLGINPEHKEYDDMDSWNLYKHLIASEVEKMVK
jgi:hypothetical protein